MQSSPQDQAESPGLAEKPHLILIELQAQNKYPGATPLPEDLSKLEVLQGIRRDQALESMGCMTDSNVAYAQNPSPKCSLGAGTWPCMCIIDSASHLHSLLIFINQL